jgi:hypothetical protein
MPNRSNVRAIPSREFVSEGTLRAGWIRLSRGIVQESGRDRNGVASRASMPRFLSRAQQNGLILRVERGSTGAKRRGA